jgi:hypothetical protein
LDGSALGQGLGDVDVQYGWRFLRERHCLGLMLKLKMEECHGVTSKRGLHITNREQVGAIWRTELWND